MNLALNKPNWKLYIGFPALIFIACYFITLTKTFKVNSDVLSLGILADLIITAPLIYFLVIRKSSISNLTTIRVFLFGLFIAGLMLGTEKNETIAFLKKWIAPAIELFVFGSIIKKFYEANKQVKLANKDQIDFLVHCRETLLHMFGSKKMAYVLASEVSMIYYAFIARSKKQVGNTFTSYKENGILAVLYALLLVLLIESIAMHFVFIMLGPITAWVLTGLSLYTCMQLFAHLRAVKLRPIYLESNYLNLRMGVAADANIALSNIKSIEIIKADKLDTDIIRIGLFKGLEGNNIYIEMYEPIEVIKMFGITKQSKSVQLFVDNPTQFKEKVFELKQNHGDKL